MPALRLATVERAVSAARTERDSFAAIEVPSARLRFNSQ